MKLLPELDIKVSVIDGAVLVGAHEKNGAIWWTVLPNPLKPEARSSDFERVGFDLVERDIRI